MTNYLHQGDLPDGLTFGASVAVSGSLAIIGRSAAVADFGWLRLHGLPAWLAWGGIHLLLLMGTRNRAVVYITWIWSWLTWGRGARLITGLTAWCARRQ